MSVLPVGDTAFALPCADPRPLADALAAAALAGVVDVVASPDRVTVVYDISAVPRPEEFAAALQAVADRPRPAATVGELHEIPVVYGGACGPDLDAVARHCGHTTHDVVGLHAGPEYVVEAVGFVPGFPYLRGLPASLAVPRLTTPRRLVAAGSVGIGGAQTGVYPCATPGGWSIIGRTPLALFDATRPRPALLRAGDRVVFRPDAAADFSPPPAEPPPVVAGADVTVEFAGLCSSLQDLGRPGHRAAGVPLSGAVDPVALQSANRIVGNAPGAVALECTLLGPRLRFERPAVVALTGAEFPGLAGGRPVRVGAGGIVDLGHATCGCRGYLAVAGGFEAVAHLGSGSTYEPARLGGVGGRRLAAGDALRVAADRPPRHAVGTAPRVGRGPTTLRLVPAGDARGWAAAAWSREWRVGSRSDRMGMRLEGEPLAGSRGDTLSVAVLPGTIQVPPDGLPIVLLADAPTIGGYPVCGQVIAADLPQAGQLRPGDLVRWRPVTLEEAHEAYRRRQVFA